MDVIKKQREIEIDIIKGIAILLMVLGHSGFPYSDYIYLFHMAIFFMCTGYCWNDKHIKDKESLYAYISSKIKSL